MQWDATSNAGFTTGTPWLKAGKSYQEINVAKEKDGVIFKFYQDLIKLRKELPIIAEGDYKAAFVNHDKVYAFERIHDNQKLLVLNNFFAEDVVLDLPETYHEAQVLISNYPEESLGKTITLKPYQTLALLATPSQQ